MNDCLFCRIASGAIPVNAVMETEKTISFPDIAPQAPTHVLVIHKQHTATLAETTEEVILGQLFSAVRETAAALQLNDFRVVINNGTEAGQSVFHLHAHLLAGRPFCWPPG
jgi:histidine triad (HIT) family protein